MQSLLAFQLAGSQLIALVAILGGFMVPIVIVVTALYFKSKRQQMWHETARVALERGQPVPPMGPNAEENEFTPPVGVNFAEWQALRRAETRSNEIKGGFVLIATGLGLYFFFAAMQGMHHMRFVGAVPGAVGVALLLHAVLERIFRKDPTPRE